MKIGISGICGRMGQRILACARADKKFEVVVGLEKEGHPRVGKAAGPVTVESEPDSIARCECLIEFTTPAATISHCAHCVRLKKGIVIGTTGLNKEEITRIKEAAQSVPVVFSPNMSIGVNLLFRLIRDSAKILKEYGIYLEEAHHIHKKDAPSGTAKKIVQILTEEGFNVTNEDVVAIREDEIVGDHSIIFKSTTDEIELSHSAKTRDIFAQGALRAALWLKGKKSGFYTMDDVLFT